MDSMTLNGNRKHKLKVMILDKDKKGIFACSFFSNNLVGPSPVKYCINIKKVRQVKHKLKLLLQLAYAWLLSVSWEWHQIPLCDTEHFRTMKSAFPMVFTWKNKKQQKKNNNTKAWNVDQPPAWSNRPRPWNQTIFQTNLAVVFFVTTKQTNKNCIGFRKTH